MNYFNVCPLFLVIIAIFTVGCSNSQDQSFVRSANDTNLKKVASAYQLYAARSGYQGPESKEALLKFLKTDPSIVDNLKLMGFERDNAEAYFISENDGQEFDFRFNVYVNPDRNRAKQPIVFEREGKEGVRQVILTNRNVLNVTSDKDYKSLLKGIVSSSDAKTDLEIEEEQENPSADQ